jgi:D-alanyl-D-alanine carboxypeptidase/D-alanyl-D-alanine-endopeptidase (penicillin-binding protein 4)
MLGFAACRGPRPATTPAKPPGPSSVTLTRLQQEIDRTLDTPTLAAGTWGVLVRSLRSEDTLYARNQRKLLIPASTLKVITLATAAERLGWDYTYETQLLGLGAIDFGFLDGDLIVRGSGDPSIGTDEVAADALFRSWAERLKALGVRSLSGRIIGDDNALDDEPYGQGWMWDDMAEAYSAGVGALQLNLNATVLTVAPGPAPGAPAIVTCATDGSGWTLRNRVSSGAAGSPAQVSTRRPGNGMILEVTGSIPVGGAPVQRRIAVENPTRHFVEELRRALIANGIDVKGPAVDIDDLENPLNPHDAVPLVVHRSPPLRTLADTMMRISQNQYAETLVKTLGAQAGRPTFDGGREVANQVLTQWGIDASQAVLADGSGLSRYNLVTADGLVTTLTHVAHSPTLDGPFRATLPVAGVDGMLSARLKGTPAEGRVQAKTGSMRNARSLSGFTHTADGEPVAFAILVNNYGVPASEIDKAIDGLLLRVVTFKRE